MTHRRRAAVEYFVGNDRIMLAPLRVQPVPTLYSRIGDITATAAAPYLLAVRGSPSGAPEPVRLRRRAGRYQRRQRRPHSLHSRAWSTTIAITSVVSKIQQLVSQERPQYWYLLAYRLPS